MKVAFALVIIVLGVTFTSCSVGKGCPTNGKNVGAERILSGDAKTMKSVKRAGKFRA